MTFFVSEEASMRGRQQELWRAGMQLSAILIAIYTSEKKKEGNVGNATLSRKKNVTPERKGFT